MKKIFIGIDFSKKKFDATAIFAENQFTQCRKSVYQTFRNNREGFRNLMDWTARIAPGADKDDFLFCGENTGIYLGQSDRRERRPSFLIANAG